MESKRRTNIQWWQRTSENLDSPSRQDGQHFVVRIGWLEDEIEEKGLKAPPPPSSSTNSGHQGAAGGISNCGQSGIVQTYFATVSDNTRCSRQLTGWETLRDRGGLQQTPCRCRRTCRFQHGFTEVPCCV
ncbi:hypothetical protein ZHAS_00007309 [Anopheles sinensis]|uniref:Uncharacterized protein n=1 Tax=Anopheles sinensis TaxID=74873 RepID=A0A084VPN4_ANOSI|nr:hypothetical protein ZHAS_00007309 [Anopheles sinensis]